MTWFDRILNSATVDQLVSEVGAGGVLSARGVVGSSASIIAAAIGARRGDPVVVVVAHLDDADEAVEELRSLGVDAARLPAMEVLPGETGLDLELLGERLLVVRRVVDGSWPAILVAPIQALMQGVPDGSRLPGMLRVFRKGDTVDPTELARWLTETGYTRVEAIESPGEFAVRGGIVDIYPPGAAPVRLDLFDDEVDGLFDIDLDTMGSDRRREHVELVGATPGSLLTDEGMVTLASLLPETVTAILVETVEIAEQARSYLERVADGRGIFDLASIQRQLLERAHAVIEMNHFSAGTAVDRDVSVPVEPVVSFSEGGAAAVQELAELAARQATVVLCQNEGEASRMGELLQEFAADAQVEVEERYLHRGFVWGEAPALALVPYHELLNRFQLRRRVRRIGGPGRTSDAFVDLKPGDHVVHRDHGIARFIGLQVMPGREGGPTEEFLTLEFARGAKLHVPASRIELVQPYVGALHGRPELSTMGGRKWSRQKDQVREAVKDLASEMLRVQAARASLPGIRYPADTVWQHEFEAEFPYQETEDQLAAIIAVKRDMTSPRPMDRLVCGDVGFGKTEVAIRAAFKAVEYGKQAAILVPTTLLAEQHERTFSERFADYPFVIESLNRFKTRGEQQEIIKRLEVGGVDVLIGTHRILSQDVRFADLGLVVIDEEQRFGVEHKHKLLEYRATTDVLTLTATPIPRTLHMSMLGLRDISSLTTPPPDRRAIVTEVLTYDSGRIKQAIERELAREGQVYFLHNRVFNIETVADDVRRLVPDARVVFGHGQMPPRQLERVMLQYFRGDADVLVSTTIIESGIDNPRANTMIINDAHQFGLGDLHQLRGRVGRHKHRAYCYLLLSPDQVVSEVALKRLRAIESFSMLGAGFKIALRDLEIRGAGNLLGAEQSGHIAAVGYEMYCQLLEQAVGELRNEKRIVTADTTIDLGITGIMPKGYIPSDARRMDVYRRLGRCSAYEELEQIERDLVSAYGDLPEAASTLVQLTELRISGALRGIRSMARRERDVVIRAARPKEIEDALQVAQGTVRPVGQADAQGLSEIYYRPPESYWEAGSIITVLRKRLAVGDEVAAGA